MQNAQVSLSDATNARHLETPISPCRTQPLAGLEYWNSGSCMGREGQFVFVHPIVFFLFYIFCSLFHSDLPLPSCIAAPPPALTMRLLSHTWRPFGKDHIVTMQPHQEKPPVIIGDNLQ